MNPFFIRAAVALLVTMSVLTVAHCATVDQRVVLVDKQQELSLILNNKNQTVIVVPEKSGTIVRFAGTELQDFLQQSFGDTVPIVSEPDTGKTSIILGENDYSREAGIDLDSLPRDGFIIKAIGKHIFIAGKDDPRVNIEKNIKVGIWGQYFERATLFGVYDFLERFVGVKFYFPGKIGTVIPEYKDLTIPAMTIVEMPDYQARKLSWYQGRWYEGEDRDVHVSSIKNLHAYRLRLESAYIPNCHGLARLGYLDRFGETNPEYFAMLANGERRTNPNIGHPGHVCFSSGIREQIFKDAKAFLTGKTAVEAEIFRGRFGYNWSPSGCQPGYFNVMPQDGFFSCQCPKCSPIWAEGSQASSDFIWNFVRETALKLKKEHVTGYLTMMAYPPYRNLPNVEIPDNVLVMVAEHGPWGIYNKETQDKDNKEIRDWVKKTGRKTWLWNYANKHGKREMPGIPQVTPLAIGEYYQQQKPYIFGAYMESETDQYIFNALNFYIFSKVCWNNDVNVTETLDEYYKLMFGAAAHVMQSIDERFEEVWIRKIGGRVVDSPLGPMAAPPSEYELWEKVYSSDEIEKLTERYDQAEKLTQENQTALERVRFFRKHFLESILNAKRKYSANKNELEDLVFSVKSIPDGATISLDGQLEETVWKDTSKIYLHPYKGNPEELKTVDTLVYALKDENNLYFAFHCEEPMLTDMDFSQRENDDKDIWKDSSIELFLNPSGDHKNYYQFLINPAGSMSDNKSQKIGMNNVTDWEWNSDATVKTSVGDNAWRVEIAIPLRNLGEFQETGFPVNFNRNRVLEKGNDHVILYTWSPFLKYGFHDLQNFGKLFFGKLETTSIVDNGDFSVLPKNHQLGKWYAPRADTIKPGQSWSLDQSTFIKGGRSLKLVNERENQKINAVQYLPDLKPNTKYLLTFYIKTKDLEPYGRGGGATVNVYDEKNRSFPENWFLGSMPWAKQGFEFTTGPATNEKNRSYIKLLINGASGTVWFDDVRLREVE